MVDAFGIDASKVYANDNDGNPAFWTLFPDHAHGKVVAALAQDQVILKAIQDKFAHPNDDKIRLKVIDMINRATVNCIGQHILGESLKPEAHEFTIYNLLKPGTALDIDNVVGAPAFTPLHDAFAARDTNAVLSLVSRKSGHALLQACISQLPGLVGQEILSGNLLGKVTDLLKSHINDIVPGIA